MYGTQPVKPTVQSTFKPECYHVSTFVWSILRALEPFGNVKIDYHNAVYGDLQRD